jgi:hypothetical protein
MSAIAGAVWRWATDQCEGGRATTAVAMKLSVAFLIGMALLAYYIAWPWAVSEYRGFKGSLANIEHTLEIRQITAAAKEGEQDDRLTRIERRQDDQGNRIDGLSDRVARIEGRRR